MTQADAVTIATALAAERGESVDVWQHVGDDTSPAQGRFLVRLREVVPPKSLAWARYAVADPSGAVRVVNEPRADVELPASRLLSASEAVYAFAAWLSGRKQALRISKADPEVLTPLVLAFVSSQALTPPHARWQRIVKPYPVD